MLIGFFRFSYRSQIYHLIMLPFGAFILIFLSSFDRDSFITTVNSNGQCSVFRNQEVIHSNVQLPMESVNNNSAVAMYINGEPCIFIAGKGQRAGVYIRHAVTLGEVRSLPYKEDVYCVCINAKGTKLYFGTESGWIC